MQVGATPSGHTRTRKPFDPQRIALGLLLIGVTIWAFLPVLNNGFINLDDHDYIINNGHVKSGLTFKGLKWVLTNTTAGNWHPLTWVSHMLDCDLFGLTPWGHHLTNVILHTLNALLVFIVFSRITGAVGRSLLMAMIFAVHPLRVESVAWAAERKDVLGLFFWMLTLWAYYVYTEYRKQGNPRSKAAYGFTVLSFALGLMAKPTVVTLPFVLLLLDYWPLGRSSPWKAGADRTTEKTVQPEHPYRSRTFSWHRLVLEKVPLFILSAAASVITFLAQRHSDAVVAMSRVALNTRLENVLVSYARYLGKILWPVNLSFFYPLPDRWGDGRMLLSVIVLIAITVSVVVALKKRPYLIVGWFWFLGTLVPMIGVVQVGQQSMADRYTYISGVGILLMVIWSIPELHQRKWRHIGGGMAAMGIFGLCVMTRRQAGYWKDSETLYRHELAVNEDKYESLIYLGSLFVETGRLDDAVSKFEQAIQLKPTLPLAHVRLATALHAQGRLDAAMAQVEESLRLKSDPALAENEMGSLLVDQGRAGEALAHYELAAKFSPRDAATYFNWGLALCFLEHYGDAVAPLEKAVELRPDHARTRYNLAIALFHTGQLNEAIRQFSAAVELEPEVPKTHYRLGLALVQAGRKPEAAEQFRAALALQPDYPEAMRELDKIK